MKWDAHNPEGRGTARVHDGWMAQFLRREAEAQAEMLVRIRERVVKDLEAKPDTVPGKETMRAAKFAQDGFKILADLQLEAAKVELLARRVTGKAPMSDDEYQAQLQALGRDAIGALSAEELEAELARKRALPAPDRG